MLVASLRDACTDGFRYTTLRNAVACMVLIAPDGACHAFGMPAWLMTGICCTVLCFACVNTTLRNFVACMVLIAPVGACHAFGMSAWLMPVEAVVGV